ncbi:MAG: CBS domain-containing protein [Gammaproteobacteria bacterium]|nr:CBS domain-containing protein [Gammaproteobacteria bacterium]
MTEDTSGSRSKPARKSWLERISNAFTGEPQDRSEVLDLLRDAQQRNLFDNYALAMIEGVFEISEEQVRDVMIPRSQMVVVDDDASLEQVMATVVPSGHSRFPVIGDNRDEVIGILLAKDLLQFTTQANEQFNLHDIVRPAAFIPESKRLNTLLREFRTSRNHMAIVVDEYGGVAGLVTIEDVLELIVGEIDDEHDIEEGINIRPQADNHFLVAALTEVEEFNEYFKVNFDDEEFDTVGGVILGRLGHMPKRGEEVEFQGFLFKVLGADSRRIHRLLVSRLAPASEM